MQYLINLWLFRLDSNTFEPTCMWLRHAIQCILRQNIMHTSLLCFTAPEKSHESYTPHTTPNCSYAQHISLHYGIIFLCISRSFFFFFLPFLSLARSNPAPLSRPQSGMKINSEDLQCAKEHDLCICCVTERQHFRGVLGTSEFPVCWRCPFHRMSSSCEKGVFYLVQLCSDVNFLSFSHKEIAKNGFFPRCMLSFRYVDINVVNYNYTKKSFLSLK